MCSLPRPSITRRDIDIEKQDTGCAACSNAAAINRSLIAATSSSRFTEKNVWLIITANLSYFVQVQVPENKMTSIHDIGETPIVPNLPRPQLSDVATLKIDSVYGEDDESVRRRYCQ